MTDHRRQFRPFIQRPNVLIPTLIDGDIGVPDRKRREHRSQGQRTSWSLFLLSLAISIHVIHIYILLLVVFVDVYDAS